jgi:hypothetical protein
VNRISVPFQNASSGYTSLYRFSLKSCIHMALPKCYCRSFNVSFIFIISWFCYIVLTCCCWNDSSRWSWLKLTLPIHLEATLWIYSKISCPCVFSLNLTKVGTKFTKVGAKFAALHLYTMHASIWIWPCCSYIYSRLVHKRKTDFLVQ